MNTNKLIETRDAKVAEAQELIDTAGSALEGDDLTRFEALETEITEINGRIEQRARVSELAKNQANVIAGSGEPELNRSQGSHGDGRAIDDRGRALTMIERLRHVDDSSKEALTDQVEAAEDDRLGRYVVATSTDEYRAAFAKIARGELHLASDAERDAINQVKTIERAMSLTDNVGGYAVPAPIDPTLILTSAGSVNPIRQIANVKTIVNDVWRGLSSGGVTASWDGEAAEVSDDTPTLDQPTVTAHKAQAFIPASIEIAMDYAGIEEDLAVEFADAKDTLEATAFITGSGSSQPYGVLTRVAAVTASRVSATTNDSFGKVDVYAALEALPARHRARAAWTANLATINLIRDFNTEANAYLEAGKLLDRPIYEASEMDGAIGTGDDDILLIGDFRNYVIADRIGMRIEYIPHLFATGNNRPSGQRGWFAFWRVGADVVNTDAFRLLRI